MENRMLAPQLWHRVAPAPTSVRQAGQSFGRGCSLSRAVDPASFLKNFSIFQRVRGDRAKWRSLR
jgi:hypothetical protein